MTGNNCPYIRCCYARDHERFACLNGGHYCNEKKIYDTFGDKNSMRIIIDLEEWAINTWFAEKENISGRMAATIERETDKARLLRFDNDELKWVPKSQMTKIVVEYKRLDTY